MIRHAIWRPVAPLFFGVLVLSGPATADALKDKAARILAKDRLWDQLAEFQETMEHLSLEEQAALSLELLESGSDGIAVSAAAALIQHRTFDDPFVPLLRDRLQAWNSTMQLGILSEIATQIVANDPAEFKMYLGVLSDVRETALARATKAGAAEAQTLRVIDQSLLLSGQIAGAPPVAAAEATLRAVPNSTGAWVTLLQADAVDNDMREIARHVFYESDKTQAPLRFLAALALGESDPAAEPFVDSTIDSIIAGWGGRTVEECVVASAAAAPDDPEHGSWARFMRTDACTLSYLSLVRGARGDAILRRCTATKNESIRDSARYAIMMTHSGLLLDETAVLRDSHEALLLAAGIVIHHPEMRDALSKKFDKKRLDAAIDAVRAAGDTAAVGDWAFAPLPFIP